VTTECRHCPAIPGVDDPLVCSADFAPAIAERRAAIFAA
jgi:hypothetical protein